MGQWVLTKITYTCELVGAKDTNYDILMQITGIAITRLSLRSLCSIVLIESGTRVGSHTCLPGTEDGGDQPVPPTP